MGLQFTFYILWSTVALHRFTLGFQASFSWASQCFQPALHPCAHYTVGLGDETLGSRKTGKKFVKKNSTTQNFLHQNRFSEPGSAKKSKTPWQDFSWIFQSHGKTAMATLRPKDLWNSRQALQGLTKRILPIPNLNGQSMASTLSPCHPGLPGWQARFPALPKFQWQR